MLSAEQVKKYARISGADMVGIASLDRFEGVPKEMDPRQIFPDAQAVIVLASRIRRGQFRAMEEGSLWQTPPGGLRILIKSCVILKVRATSAYLMRRSTRSACPGVRYAPDSARPTPFGFRLSSPPCPRALVKSGIRALFYDVTNSFGNSRCGQSATFAQDIERALGNELIGPAEPQKCSREMEVCQDFTDGGSESAGDHPVFNGDNNPGYGGVGLQKFLIQGSNEPWIDDARLQPGRLQPVGNILGQGNHVAQRPDLNFPAGAENLGMAARQ